MLHTHTTIPNAQTCHFVNLLSGKRIYFFALIGLLFSACNGKTQLEKYYFPLKKLLQPQVYEYRGVNAADKLPPMYWYYQTVQQGDSIFFASNLYDVDFESRQLVREVRVKNGMLLRELFLYSPNAEDSTVRVEATIHQGALFPFEVTDTNSVFVYDVAFQNPKDSAMIRLIRNRRYIGKSEYLVKGKKYTCIDIAVRERYENTKNGTIGIDLQHLERYAEGLGLVYSRHEVGDGKTLEYELYDTYSMEQLEEKFKRKMNAPVVK